jgi:hypothetical protein
MHFVTYREPENRVFFLFIDTGDLDMAIINLPVTPLLHGNSLADQLVKNHFPVTFGMKKKFVTPGYWEPLTNTYREAQLYK